MCYHNTGNLFRGICSSHRPCCNNDCRRSPRHSIYSRRAEIHHRISRAHKQHSTAPVPIARRPLMIEGRIERYNEIYRALARMPQRIADTKFSGTVDMAPLLRSVQRVAPVDTGRLRASFKPVLAPPGPRGKRRYRPFIRSRLHYAPNHAKRMARRLPQAGYRARRDPAQVLFFYKTGHYPKVEITPPLSSALPQLSRATSPLSRSLPGGELSRPVSSLSRTLPEVRSL